MEAEHAVDASTQRVENPDEPQDHQQSGGSNKESTQKFVVSIYSLVLTACTIVGYTEPREIQAAGAMGSWLH